jgi:hypothetical protein
MKCKIVAKIVNICALGHASTLILYVIQNHCLLFPYKSHAVSPCDNYTVKKHEIENSVNVSSFRNKWFFSQLAQKQEYLNSCQHDMIMVYF